MTRYLIVNADDFGLSAGVNRGIIECAERGILTSASLMVRQPGAASAAEYAKKYPTLSIGLHVDLGEWAYLDGTWVRLYKVTDTDDAFSVAREVEKQLTAFCRLVGRAPSHFDSHQHAHRKEPVRSVLLEIAQKLSVPLRECDPSIRHCGDFYGQTGEGEPLVELINVESLKKILKTLPGRVTELACHPGYANGLSSLYRVEREREIQTLCDPTIKTSLRDWNIELCSFRDVVHKR